MTFYFQFVYKLTQYYVLFDQKKIASEKMIQFVQNNIIDYSTSNDFILPITHNQHFEYPREKRFFLPHLSLT